MNMDRHTKTLPSRRARAARGVLTVLAGLALLAPAAGCALTNKAEALSIRWYTPESTRARLTSASAGERGGEGPRLGDGALQVQLGRVTSGVNLREKIAFRDSTFEQGFYEDKRWTERPEVYVRRALERTLFEEHGFQRALASQAPALEVEVVAFEEVTGPSSAHAARVQLKVVLHDAREALLERTFTVERPIAPDTRGFAGFVQATAQALDAATEEVAAEAERVILAGRAAPRAD